MQKLLLATVLTLGATTASAACPSGRSPVFSCTLDGSGAVVEVCHDAGTVTYTRKVPGESASPSLTVSVAEVDFRPWTGIGRDMTTAIVFHAGDTTHAVRAHVHRLWGDEEEVRPMDGSLEIRKGTEPPVQQSCVAASVVDRMDVLETAIVAAGRCYDYSATQWRPCPPKPSTSPTPITP